jgi:cation diffusion facilitator family transporter
MTTSPSESACCSHGHSHGGHGHAHTLNTTGGRLLITLVFNLVIPVVQIIGGIFANSMALISDAMHNFSDFFALFVAYLANKIGRRPPSARNTFGYKRAEILSAALNVMLLSVAAGFIVYEGFIRLLHPESVTGNVVAIIAGVGVVGNGLSALMLHRDAKHNLNIRGAFLHMVGDLMTSVAVVLNGIILMFKPWYWLDPLLSLVIAVFILKNCWLILREAVGILMDATPAGLDIHELKHAMETIPGVDDVHHLHAWSICANSTALSCHAVVQDQPVSQTARLRDDLRHLLRHRFAIDHPVLQFETGLCGEEDVFCHPSDKEA